MTSQADGLPTYEAWFTRRPRLALAGIVVLFVLITSWRIALGADAITGITLFYVVPVSLAALAWGRLAGAVAIGVALLLLLLWVLANDVDLTPLGYASRIVPIVLTGLLLGDTSDRLRRAQDAHLRQVGRELRYRQAVEVNDSLLQGMAAAKWAIESGNLPLGIKALDDTISAGQSLVSELIRDAGMGPVRADAE